MFDLREAAKERLLIAAHRGCWMGNIPCNSMGAFNAALLSGADIVELAVSRSLDGTLFVFHPGTEPVFLKSEKLISQMTDAEVRRHKLVSSDGAFTECDVPTFDDVLDGLKGRCFINVDKFPFYPEEILSAIRKHKMQAQVLVKTDQDEKYYRMMEEIAPEIPYMTFAKEIDRDSEMLLKRKLNYLGTEALFKDEMSEFAHPAYHEKMHKMGLLTWANAIVFNYKTVHAAGHNDDISATGNPDNGWGYLAELGYNMIQTDWVEQCVRYLDLKKYRKDTRND